MKYLTLLPLALPLLISCQNSATETHAQNSTTLSESRLGTAFTEVDELLGYYVKTAHEGAWLLFLEEGENGLKGSLTQYQDMLPPAEFLDGSETKADVRVKHMLEFFSPDKNSGTFQSNIGSGKINAQKIVFDSIIETDAPLVLVREATYPRPE
ncbi:MAG: hypothetical protein AAFY45_02225 [Bacteroidota bacterium]